MRGLLNKQKSIVTTFSSFTFHLPSLHPKSSIFFWCEFGCGECGVWEGAIRHRIWHFFVKFVKLCSPSQKVTWYILYLCTVVCVFEGVTRNVVHRCSVVWARTEKNRECLAITRAALILHSVIHTIVEEQSTTPLRRTRPTQDFTDINR